MTLAYAAKLSITPRFMSVSAYKTHNLALKTYRMAIAAFCI